MAKKSNINASLSDVKFHSVSIVPKTGAAISIAGLWNVINIHENIFRPAITGNIQINDTVNLRATYGLKFEGQDRLFISFSKPSITATGSAKFAKTFVITGIKEFKQNENGSGASYVLLFCSEELWLSISSKKISRTFTGNKYTDYVKSICKTDLLISDKQLNGFEDSFGPAQTHNIVDMSPFEAIELFERYSINEIKSPFLFFENYNGYNFLSLAKMLDGTSVVPGGLIVSTAKNSAEGAEYVPLNVNEILNFNFEKISNTLEQSKNGGTSGVFESFDILTGDNSRFNFIVGDDMDPGNLSNKESEFPGASITTPEEANRNFWMNTKNRSNMPWRLTSFANNRYLINTNISPYPIETAFRENDTNYENILMQRQAMLTLLEVGSVNYCEVAGNPAFTVGTTVDIQFPAFTKSETAKRNLDPYLSGRYLITKVRHNLTKSTGIRTFISLATNSPLNPIA